MKTEKTLNVCSNLDNILEQYGNINYISKEELYLLVDYIRNCFEITMNGHAFNIIEFYKNNFSDILDLQFHQFNDKKVGGFLVKNKYPEKSYIVINNSKDSLSSVFDLTHELIHFLLHPEDRQYYISSTLCNFDNFEWQANEGAAELLVPYKKFIPQFVKNIKNCKNYLDYNNLIKQLSDNFVVSTAVIEYRIYGLKYEIFQYENGVPISDLEFLSQRAQEENGIDITPYNIIFKSKGSLKEILSKFSFTNTKNDFHNQKDEKITNVDKLDEYNIQNWEDIIQYFRETGRIILYTNLINTEMLPIDEDTIGINFINGLSKFGQVVLNKEQNKELIQEQVDKLFNKKMNIRFINLAS